MPELDDLDLSKIKYLGDVQRLEVRPGDVVVLSVAAPLSMATSKRLVTYVEGILPGTRCIILDGGLKIGVLSAQEAGHGSL